MKKEEIESLLALYYEGRTDAQDEERLWQAFLKADDLPPDLEAERALFLSLHRAEGGEDRPVPEGLEARLEALINRKAAESRRRWLRWGAVAASLLLIVGIGWGVAEMRRPLVPQDTFTNPEDAHRALQAILMEMSREWNAGMEQLEASQRDIVAANREMKKEFEQQ